MKHFFFFFLGLPLFFNYLKFMIGLQQIVWKIWKAWVGQIYTNCAEPRNTIQNEWRNGWGASSKEETWAVGGSFAIWT
jgi:hypothetical protein